MSKQPVDLKRPWQYFISTIGVVGSIVGVLTIQDGPYRRPTLVVCGIVAALCLVWAVLLLITRWLPSRDPLFVERAAGDQVFDEGRQFGENWWSRKRRSYPSRELTLGWWRRYSKGLFILRSRKHDFLGYLALYPITESTFGKIRDGRLTVDDIPPDGIESGELSKHKYWYIADLMRRARPDNAPLIIGEYMTLFLIAGALELWLEADDTDETVSLITFGVTTAGRDCLRERSFEPVNGSDVFIKTVPRTVLTGQVRQMKKKLRSMKRMCDPLIRDVDWTAARPCAKAGVPQLTP